MPLDWSQCPAVESIPGKVSGAWVFRGTRMPVSIVFENLEDGMTIDEVMEQFDVTPEQVHAVLEFVTRSLDRQPTFIGEVEKGLAAADRGEFIEHEEIGKIIDGRYPG